MFEDEKNYYVMQPYKMNLTGMKTTKEKKNKHQANMSTVGLCFVLLLIRKSSFPTLNISPCGPFEI